MAMAMALGRRRERVELRAPLAGAAREALTPEALDFIARLEAEFAPSRRELLARRGEPPTGPGGDGGAAHAWLRSAAWRAAPPPPDLLDRRVELVASADDLTAGAWAMAGHGAVVADLADATAPTWANLMAGQAQLRRLARAGGRGGGATVQPRSLAVDEPRLLIGGRPVAAALVDFALDFVHNARARIERGSGPYVSLIDVQGHLEARFWNDVFDYAQDLLGLPLGNVRATVRIDNLRAAFEMEEILYELRPCAAALSLGADRYVRDVLRAAPGADSGTGSPPPAPRAAESLAAAAPAVRALRARMARVAHRRGVLALDDAPPLALAAVPPARRDALRAAFAAEVAERARAGVDGVRVADPALVEPARAAMDGVLAGRVNLLAAALPPAADDGGGLGTLLALVAADDAMGAGDLAAEVEAAVHLVYAWLGGRGRVAVGGRLVDAAAADLGRWRVRQWVHQRLRLVDGGRVDAERVRAAVEDVRRAVVARASDAGDDGDASRLSAACALFERAALAPDAADSLSELAFARIVETASAARPA